MKKIAAGALVERPTDGGVDTIYALLPDDSVFTTGGKSLLGGQPSETVRSQTDTLSGAGTYGQLHAMPGPALVSDTVERARS
jgi:hypothetical protein